MTIRSKSLLLVLTHVALASAVWAGDPPPTAVPPGYGHYCSLLYPSGGWAFGALSGTDSRPCEAMLRKSPGGTIERARLWSERGENNVLVRCEGDLGVYRGTGGAILTGAYNEALGKKGCVFTVAPVALPVFNLPYGPTHPFQKNPSADVSLSNGFNFNLCSDEVTFNVVDYGQAPIANHPTAHSVDRLGQQRCRLGTLQECQARNPPEPAGCHVESGHGGIDWPMPEGKPILATADGIVRDARWRDVSGYDCGDDDQAEVYIEHQVGQGLYAERFVTAYIHMSKIDGSLQPGSIVSRGDNIGAAGQTGCATGDHLHFGLLRLTNLSGHRSYDFATTSGGYGVNGSQGVIDPFAWAAPENVDPWAWRCLESTDPKSLPEPGAFSINLWRPGQAPPNSW